MNLTEQIEAARRDERRATRMQALQGAGVAVLSLAVLGGAFAFAGTQPVVRVALVVDASPTNEPETRCSDLSAMLAPYHGGAWERHLLHVELWSTGAVGSGQEPKPVDVLTRDPAPSGLEALAGDSRLADFEAELASACDGIATTQVSPLFRSAQAAAQDLHAPTDPALSCDQEHVSCQLLMRSDFIEEDDQLLVAARLGQELPDREARLAVTGLDRVFFCGFSQRTTTKTYPAAAEIQADWQPEVPEAAAAVTSFANTCT